MQGLPQERTGVPHYQISGDSNIAQGWRTSNDTIDSCSGSAQETGLRAELVVIEAFRYALRLRQERLQ